MKDYSISDLKAIMGYCGSQIDYLNTIKISPEERGLEKEQRVNGLINRNTALFYEAESELKARLKV